MQEMIFGYRVHPSASVFPLIDGDEFDSLVESIGNNGIQHPIIVRRSPDGDELIDGRNRLRAAQVARERGYVVDIPVTDWKEDGRNIAEWIWDTNALRRHLTEDAWVLASASITQMIRAENDERQKAAQFKPGAAAGPGRGKTVNTKTDSPAPRDVKKMNARSTAGQVAAKAGVSMHKARQAIAVLDALEAGTITPEAVAEVKEGKKKLRSVMPKKTKSAKKRRTMSALLVAIRDIVAEWKDADHNVEVLKDELRTQLERL